MFLVVVCGCIQQTITNKIKTTSKNTMCLRYNITNCYSKKRLPRLMTRPSSKLSVCTALPSRDFE